MVVFVVLGESKIVLSGGIITCNCGEEVARFCEFGAIFVGKSDGISEFRGICEVIGMPFEEPRSIVINSSEVIDVPIIGNPIKGWKSKGRERFVRSLEIDDFRVVGAVVK